MTTVDVIVMQAYDCLVGIPIGKARQMPANPPGDGFEETKEIPRGRKAREVPDLVWDKLKESAERGVAFTKSGPPTTIDELRRDLGAAAVRAKYEVTMGTEKVNATRHKLTFAAKRKPEPEAQAANGQATEPVEAAAEPANA